VLPKAEKATIKAIPKTSSISSSLDDVRRKLSTQKAEAEKEKEQEQAVDTVREIRKTSFTLEELQTAWESYLQLEDSKVNQVILKNCQIELDDSIISITLDSSMQETQFQKVKTPLRGYLVKQLKNDEIEFKVEIKELPKEGKRLYTEQDKFEYLAKKYPQLTMLKNQLGLDWQH